MAGRKKLDPGEKKIRTESFIKKKVVDLVGKKECEEISVQAVNKEYEKLLKKQGK
jgi:hypothetical protein